MRTSWPQAYLLTYRTYGTWLHGDERGAHHRRRRGYRSRPVDPSPAWRAAEARLMVRPAVRLDAAARRIAERVPVEVCQHRGWALLAIHARTNHVHAVLSGACRPEVALSTIKAWSTRRLVEAGLFAAGAPIWSRHGSTLYLWSQQARERAVDYVLDGQGVDLE